MHETSQERMISMMMLEYSPRSAVRSATATALPWHSSWKSFRSSVSSIASNHLDPHCFVDHSRTRLFHFNFRHSRRDCGTCVLRGCSLNDRSIEPIVIAGFEVTNFGVIRSPKLFHYRTNSHARVTCALLNSRTPEISLTEKQSLKI